MFTQPELGKIIADLRKSKGWTQEELVEKCNLSVRTIQRIESGEVTPRSYTSRLIFSALEYDIHVQEDTPSAGEKDSLTSGNRPFSFRPWLRSLPLPDKNTMNGFFSTNLHLMKKVILLSLALCAIAYGLVVLFSKSDAQKAKETSQIIVQANQNYIRWYNRGQIDSCVSIYADNACLFIWMAPNICGKMNIYQHLQAEMNTGYTIMEQKMEQFRMDGNIAFENGTWLIKMPSGELTKGKYMTEWHKVGKKWLIATDAGSIVP